MVLSGRYLFLVGAAASAAAGGAARAVGAAHLDGLDWVVGGE